MLLALSLLLALQDAGAAESKVSIGTFDTKDFEVKRRGLAKIEWEDHWFEGQKNSDGTTSFWLVQRFSYDGEMRMYDRGSIGSLIQQRKGESGGRLVDDCRSVGPLKRCRRAELMRLPVTIAEMQQLAAMASPIDVEFFGMTQKPYVTRVDSSEVKQALTKASS